MFDEAQRFVIENFQQQPPFSSFLPGIAGETGIPLWCFYQNRGQGVASFGSRNKDHSIMEFFPAQAAYQRTPLMGFRTFLKLDGGFCEPFSSPSSGAKMIIGMNELELVEELPALGITVRVVYMTLPEEPVGALVRRVTVENHHAVTRELSWLDGIPALIPYGISLLDLKSMGQTMQAWMQVEDTEQFLPYYRVRYSTGDTAVVTKIDGGNFFFALSGEDTLLPVVVDANRIFSYDTSCRTPAGFWESGWETLLAAGQATENQTPCAFSAYQTTLPANGSRTITQVIGHAGEKELAHVLLARCREAEYFEQKHLRACSLATELTSAIATKTAEPLFDSYCRQTMLDNLLRGGYPTQIGDKICYLYGRKHGDPERDYNFFQLSAEYYSQGNGNFRDMLQNRRCDCLFFPHVGEDAIHTFFCLLQLDGYNPLQIGAVSFRAAQPDELLRQVAPAHREKMAAFFEHPFSPGELVHWIEREKIELCVGRDAFLAAAVTGAKKEQFACFGEGYWSDHWTYLLDLLESYLALYPEREESLLFLEPHYTWFESRAVVLPRHLRYQKTPQGIRQYRAVDEKRKHTVLHTAARTQYGAGEVYTVPLVTKLTLLAVLKFAALDMAGMGVEMEGGKPGWYDALNGLPGLVGSSVAESCELARLLEYLINLLKQCPRDVSLPQEGYALLLAIEQVLLCQREQNQTKFWVWEQCNIHKESYREKTAFGVDGQEQTISAARLEAILELFSGYLLKGISAAVAENDGLCPTYFSYQVTEYEETTEGILPKAALQNKLPLFLEGVVRHLKLSLTQDERQQIYSRVKQSPLYDSALGMYKVNASLAHASYELGRAKAFSPGWLENESIWLHMEYKYLLGLLKSGLYDAFFDTLHAVGVPFQPPQRYGRSPLENVSFIASSANPNPDLHGRGFVARLSGSTAEWLEIWQRMFFGAAPFSQSGGELICRFAPAIPAYLVPDTLELEAVFLGGIPVRYRLNRKAALIPGQYRVEEIVLTALDGTKWLAGDTLRGQDAVDVRAGKITRLEVSIGIKE